MLLHDLRYAARILRKSRGFTLVASLSLALAIGANTTVFSVAKRLLYDRLAVRQPIDLRLLTWTASGDRAAETGFSHAVYEEFRARNQVFADLAAFHVTAANATVGTDAQRVLIHEVSGNYYSVLGVQPELGRLFEAADDAPASAPVAVISDEFWQREFARSRDAIGRSMRLNDVVVTIVGVTPKDFTGAESTLPSQAPAVTVTLAKATIVTPASNGRDWLADPTSWGLNVIGRIRPGVTDSTAQAALDTRLSAAMRSLLPVRARDEVPRIVLRDGSRGLFAQRQAFAAPMSVLMIFLGLVLLLACANVATLMLARGARRRQEMSVRLALGAGRTRLVRQLLVESLLLAAMGGVGGLAVGYMGRMAIPRLAANAWHLATVPVRFDWQVFAFTAAVTALTGVLCGVSPAFAAARAGIAGGMHAGGRSGTLRTGLGGRTIVAFQIALSTLLVIGAGLFIRSLAGLSAVDAGFRTDHLLLAQVVLPQNRYPAGRNVAFHERLEEAIAALPGVMSVTAAEVPYLAGDQLTTRFLPEGETPDPNRRQAEAYNVVGVHFFETLVIPVLAGRAFGPGDTITSPRVAVVNQRLAQLRFPNQDPIGRRFTVGEYAGYGDILTGGEIQIVGVCADTRYADLHDAPPPQFFVPYVQQTQVRRLTYQVRTVGAAEALVPALRRIVQAADAQLPLVNVRTEQQQIDADLQDERLFVALTSGFGLLALVLASVGVYGVMAYSVARRTQEIGIRLALGAVPRQVLASVLRDAWWLSASGIAAGLGASFALARLVRSMLFGIAPSDPATLGAAAALLLAIALGASWIPARRAAGVDPMEALRRE